MVEDDKIFFNFSQTVCPTQQEFMDSTRVHESVDTLMSLHILSDLCPISQHVAANATHLLTPYTPSTNADALLRKQQ
jgi:hypothetical protein